MRRAEIQTRYAASEEDVRLYESFAPLLSRRKRTGMTDAKLWRMDELECNLYKSILLRSKHAFQPDPGDHLVKMLLCDDEDLDSVHVKPLPSSSELTCDNNDDHPCLFLMKSLLPVAHDDSQHSMLSLTDLFDSGILDASNDATVDTPMHPHTLQCTAPIVGKATVGQLGSNEHDTHCLDAPTAPIVSDPAWRIAYNIIIDRLIDHGPLRERVCHALR